MTQWDNCNEVSFKKPKGSIQERDKLHFKFQPDLPFFGKPFYWVIL